MVTGLDDDGSEDVNDFLARIRELGDQRDREDQERDKKLEEDEIMKARQERAARRAERARSISPNKGSPASTIGSTAGGARSLIDTPTHAPTLSPTKQQQSLEMPTSSPLAMEPSKPDPPTQSGLGRSNTLSWQQRPSSRTSTAVRTRPLSVVAAGNSASLSPSATQEKELSKDTRSALVEAERDPVASQSNSTPPPAHPLASMFANKDPSWFRQTEDRGKGSAAYRKSEEPENEDLPRSGSIRMPGLSSDKRDTYAGGMEATGSAGARPKSVVGGIMGSLESIRLDPPSGSDQDSSKTPMMSPSQGRISPERPSSPTKGLGGFVQSAMLKRSDSVTKRWSAQVPPGLQRGDSITRDRASRDLGIGSVAHAGVARSPSPNKMQISEAGSEAGKSLYKDENEDPVNIPETRSSRSPPPAISTSRPASPSKDTKRWSPVKSSWLENAINKTDSPKPLKSAAPQQPAWMAELQKAKAARASVDIGKPSPAATEAPPNRSVQEARAAPVLEDDEHISATADPSKELDINPEAEIPQDAVDKPVDSTASAPKRAPSVSKPKPQTPPKKDFRSSLKKSSVDIGKKGDDVPEFKKAFGNLKRAETKSYKAPDTLKENIMRGKTGLNATGGPQKTERKDEFKESILARKKEFAAAPTKPLVRNPSQLADKAVPEALAKRTGMLNKTQSIDNNSTTSSTVSTDNAPSTRSPNTNASARASAAPSQVKSSALAARFNPNLAGLLARGPPAPATSSSPERPSGTGSSTTRADSPSVKGPELTHATKSRARGPKRKPPASKSTRSATEDTRETVKPAGSSLENIESSLAENLVSQSIADKMKSYNQIKVGLIGDAAKVDSLGITGAEQSTTRSPVAEDKSRETVSTPSLSATPKSKPPPPKSPSNRISSINKTPTVVSNPPASPRTPKSPSKSNNTKSSDSERRSPTVRRSTLESPSSWEARTPPISTKPKPRSPETKRSANTPSTATNTQSPQITSRSTPAAKSNEATSPELQRVKSPLQQESPIKGDPSPAVPLKSAVARGFSAAKSPVPSNLTNGSAFQAIQGFFGDFPASKSLPGIDAGVLLKNAARIPDKIRTLRKQIWQLTSDGKRVPLTTEQEYVLFEECMYIVAHVFGSSAGKHTTDAYLWVGDGVSPSAVEDAQLFARNAAKEFGATGRLTVMHQGKESSNFFEALGGIVIVRRGNGRDASATYMLCGRKHLGQMAFDEVDFDKGNLCSGFPFIISATGGTLYLWKGKGSGADELGCARLIAMDLGLTGEIEEVDDGSEHAAFWEAFRSSQAESTRIGGHWPLKANKETYVTRLYIIDDARPRSAGLGGLWGLRANTPAGDGPGTADIHEISPFAQKDLSQDGIYVLDAYFEVYVILCWRSSARFPAFKSALYFAQEYAILAASTEDRPFVPTSHVLFAGASPTYFKTAFRKWDESRVTTQPVGSGTQASTLPLHEVIAALAA